MSNDIRIRKGLDIHLEGEADKTTQQLPLAALYGIKPIDFHGVIPKLLLREGSEVKAGEALFFSKSDERIMFPSPVSGTIKEIVRGNKLLLHYKDHSSEILDITYQSDLQRDRKSVV